MQLKVQKIIHKTSDCFVNLFLNQSIDISYITEDNNWVINEVGKDLLLGLKKHGINKTRITTTTVGLRNQVIHFGSCGTFLKKHGFKSFHHSNQAVLSWFHFIEKAVNNCYIIKGQEKLRFIQTACNLTRNDLINFGVDPQKIEVIPLGVDLNVFQVASIDLKEKIRDALEIPKNVFVVGSFQKDGVGWGNGINPKLIKGPDIFIEAVSQLSKSFPIFVLLVGPSRGYVKFHLEKRGILYKDVGFLANAKDVAKYYKALDLYLITSRIEGGPQAILETMASGVPLVSTKVGMAVDVIIDGENGFLAEIENVGEIVQKAKLIIENQNLKQKLINNALETVQNYSWEKIAKQYYQKMYSKMGL